MVLAYTLGNLQAGGDPANSAGEDPHEASPILALMLGDLMC